MPTKKPILSVVIEDSLLREIEKYRYEKRLRSTSKAAVELIEIGLKSIEGKEEDS